jgi:hypothetical protein
MGKSVVVVFVLREIIWTPGFVEREKFLVEFLPTARSWFIVIMVIADRRPALP